MAEGQHSEPVGTLHIPLTGLCGDRRVVRGWVAVLNDEVGRGLAQYPWYLCAKRDVATGYAARNLPDRGRTRGGVVYMHRLVFERYHGPIPPGLVVDHIDRDPLNNRPDNLRAVTQADNMLNVGRRRNNTSGFTGVYWWKTRGMWRAQINLGSRPRSLGLFACPVEAAAAVNAAYRLHHSHLPEPNPQPG
jgi:hypothetical protein